MRVAYAYSNYPFLLIGFVPANSTILALAFCPIICWFVSFAGSLVVHPYS